MIRKIKLFFANEYVFFFGMGKIIYICAITTTYFGTITVGTPQHDVTA